MIFINEVVGYVDKNGKYRKQGKFLCIFCNNEVIRYYYSGLKQKSCGCIPKNLDNHPKKHGGTGDRLYNIYRRMKYRCSNVTNYRYGGRGITICPEWTNDYVKFRDWSLSNGYKEGLELDRRNNDGNYEPSNCRWITHKENCNNRDLEHYRYKKSTKLKTIEVNEIRALDATGVYTQKGLAEIYNVTQSHISDIINYKRWKSI